MKKAIVIGATSGLGKGLAKVLVENNFRLGITGRRLALLKELQAEKPDSFIISTFDITETDSVSSHLEQLVTELGGLDLLIISSGTGDLNKTLDFGIEQRTIETNVLGFTCIADWAFNYFEKTGSGQLAAISSIGGLRGNGLAPSYNASKAYQINYLEGLRQKAAKLKIPVIVTDIRPGFVNTEMAKGEGLFWVANVDKAVKQIFKALKKKKKVVYITRRWAFLAILLKLLPRTIYSKI